MLCWAAVFLIISLVAGALGGWGIAGTAAGIAKFLFVVFLVIFLIALAFGRHGWTRPVYRRAPMRRSLADERYCEPQSVRAS
jgi:uncharacterized membrane protein YtjA (UPF0391 family)